jgi:hypothetical protein
LVGKNVLKPAAPVEMFVVETKPDFPNASFIVRIDGLASECRPIKIQELVGLFVFFNPVLKFIVGCDNFLSVEELRLFPVSKIKHDFILFSSEYQSRRSMDNFVFF